MTPVRVNFELSLAFLCIHWMDSGNLKSNLDLQFSFSMQLITRRQVVDCGTFPGQSVRGGLYADHRGVPPQIVSHTKRGLSTGYFGYFWLSSVSRNASFIISNWWVWSLGHQIVACMWGIPRICGNRLGRTFYHLSCRLPSLGAI